LSPDEQVVGATVFGMSAECRGLDHLAAAEGTWSETGAR
jgi:hypothetical protein